jgi:hypothetical protein
MKFQTKQIDSNFSCNKLYKFILKYGQPYVLDPGLDQLGNWVKNGYSWVCDDGRQVAAHSALIPYANNIVEIRNSVALNGAGYELYKQVFLPQASQNILLAVVKDDNLKGLSYFSHKCGFQEIKQNTYQTLVGKRNLNNRNLNNRKFYMLYNAR